MQNENEVEMKETGENVWKMISDSSKKEGNIPVILVRHPDSEESLWLNMEIDDELLGKLIKQSLMAQVPISGPLSDFIEDTDCITCHPDDIEIRR